MLSNSSMRGPVGSGALKASAAMSLGLNSPRANSPKSPKTSLAFTIEGTVPPGPERTVALRKLLEAKDAAVRAVVFPGG